METLNHYYILNLWKYVSNIQNRQNVLKTCDFNTVIRNFFEARDFISKKGMLSVLLYFSLDSFVFKYLNITIFKMISLLL
jgi:glutathionyl-hydroquinone reductase